MNTETLGQLRDFQLRFLREWLASDEARDAWLVYATKASELLLQQPLASLVEIAAIERAIDSSTSVEAVEHTAEPTARAVATELAQRLNEREEPAADFLSGDARNKLDELVARADIIDEALSTALVRDSAMEAVMRDVLYDALVEFDKRVNPFFADWGIPALLDSLPRVVRGSVKKAFVGMRDDFSKRLEPEIRRFLEVFARRSLEQSVELTLSKSADPEFVALRKNVLAAVLDRPLSELCWAPSEERGSQLIEALTAVIRDVLSHATTRAELKRAARELLVDRWGSRQLGEVLDELAIKPPDVAPVAEAAWPALRAVLSGDAAMAQISELLDASHAAWLKERPGD